MNLESLIIENMRLISSLMIIGSITLIAYVLHRAGTPQPFDLLYLDFTRVLNKIRGAKDYQQVSDCYYDIENFEYQHFNDDRFAQYLKILNEEFNEAKHSVLTTLSLYQN